MNSDQARQRAEKRFKQEERVRDGQKAMIEYEVQARATREKDCTFESAPISQGSPGADRGAAREADHTTPPRAAKNSSSLTFTALHPSYAVNSAPPLTCAGEVIE